MAQAMIMDASSHWTIRVSCWLLKLSSVAHVCQSDDTWTPMFAGPLLGQVLRDKRGPRGHLRKGPRHPAGQASKK